MDNFHCHIARSTFFFWREWLDTEWTSYLYKLCRSNASNAVAWKITGATNLMCISLRLKTNLRLATYFFGQTDLCTEVQINATVCKFCRYNKPSALAYSFGTFPSYWVIHLIEHWPNKGLLFKFRLSYGGFRALTISNLASSAYGLNWSFLWKE